MTTTERAKKKFGLRETFGIDLGFEKDSSGKLTKKKAERYIEGFAEPTEHTPVIDEGYVFPQEETKVLLLGIVNKDRVLLTGHTGTGKTSLVEQVAARLNYNVVKISFDGNIQRQDLVGTYVVKSKDGQSVTEFVDGVLPKAFEMPGTVIIFDEWDAIGGDCAFVMQRAMQRDDGHLMLMEDGARLVKLHEDNVIVATANTIGQGDETGLYSHGTKVQNYSQINRFSLTIQMDYLPEEQEIQILKNKFPDLDFEDEIKPIVEAVRQLRKGYIQNELSVPLSPRDMINWAEKVTLMRQPIRAAKYCFLNRMPPEDSTSATGVLHRIFKPEEGQ